MSLQNISGRVVGNDLVLVYISPSSIFTNMLLVERFHQNCLAALAAVSINGFIWENLYKPEDVDDFGDIFPIKSYFERYLKFHHNPTYNSHANTVSFY